MLTPGNHKLGGALIWGFALPSGDPAVCVGLSADCLAHCYARLVERLRPAARRRYERNLRLTRAADFERRVRYFILAHDVAVVRLHVGGDFYSAAYARKWLRVMRRLPGVRFFFYTRSWRDPAIRAVLERMARLRNCRAWYSCDRGTGVPARVPLRIRLAWLMTASDDLPPPGTALAFRIRRLRRRPRTRINGARVCPEEDGVARAARVTCDRCGVCWRPLPADASGRVPLPVVRREPQRPTGTGREVPPAPPASAPAGESP